MAQGGILRWQKMLIGIAAVIGALTLALIIVGYFYARQAPESTILPYPAPEDLESITIPSGLRVVQALSPEDIDETFSNIEDLAWLEPVARGNRAFLFAESHYYRYIDHLRNRVLFALNTYDRYPLLLLERQYSFSPFWDHYAGISDDDEARNFYEGVMYQMVETREMYELLEHLRLWNRAHPESVIHIGAYDIEHKAKTTVREVLLPYFRSMDPSFDLDHESVYGPEDIEALLEPLEKKLVEAQERDFTGEYPFLTPQFAANVIGNIKSFVLAYGDRQRGFRTQRQQAMIRNLIDPAYFGSFFESGKVMISAGSMHLPSRVPPQPDADWHWEGSYLSYLYEPTSGKTYSLCVEGCAYQFGEMSEADLKDCLPTGSNYRRLVEVFQEAYELGEVESDQYYSFWREPDLYDSTMLRLAYDNDHVPMLIDGVPRALLESRGRGRYPHPYGYDARVYIPRSPIQRVLPKREVSEAGL